VAWADNAGDPSIGDAGDASPDEQAAALAALGIVDDSCDPVVSLCGPTTATTSTTSTTSTSIGGLLLP
jgi:hypothetical protein